MDIHLDQDRLFSLSPLDGRYHSKVSALQDTMSEAALISYRLKVEAEWLFFLLEKIKEGVLKHPLSSQKNYSQIKALLNSFTPSDIKRVKEIEKITNHDVKACEYFLAEKLSDQPEAIRALLHFCCTSEDINNLAYALMLKDCRKNHLLPLYENLLAELKDKALQYKKLAMLSRTHGQAATPTTLGKEFAVFLHRLNKQIEKLKNISIEGKINGAVGNYNAHLVCFPEADWPKLCQEFVEKKLGLHFNPLTTQIENHDHLSEFLDTVSRINTIAIGLCRDVWSYIAISYFGQIAKENEVGSSTMPHKVNPIDFENAEGNFGVSTALAKHMSEKLLISRWQRDLSDSTVLRNLGSVFGYQILAVKSLITGLRKIEARSEIIKNDLECAWEVLAEPLQMLMRKEGMSSAYDLIKQKTRGKKLSQESFYELVTASSLSSDSQKTLLALTPEKYIGLSAELTTA